MYASFNSILTGPSWSKSGSGSQKFIINHDQPLAIS